MEELVVSGADLLSSSEFGLLDIRAASVSIQDAVSAELIRKAGASDASDALKLVVGASVNEGKYATVRGLSDRYTGTTLNGVRVPSADPRRRAVQVDLFPTGTIDSVTVTKTFQPDLQGDFTGGGVDLRRARLGRTGGDRLEDELRTCERHGGVHRELGGKVARMPERVPARADIDEPHRETILDAERPP